MNGFVKKLIRKICNRLNNYTRLTSDEYVEQLRLGGGNNWKECAVPIP